MNSSIHLKLDYTNSVNSKKEILLSEKAIIQLMTHIRGYTALKKQENSIKNSIKENITLIKKEIEKIEFLMPQDTHVNLQKKDFEVSSPEIIPKANNLVKKKGTKTQIEQELAEIEAKLARLQ